MSGGLSNSAARALVESVKSPPPSLLKILYWAAVFAAITQTMIELI